MNLKKTSILTLALSCALVSHFASANGVTEGASVAAKIAQAVGHNTVTCTSSTDQVILEVDQKGQLRMIARYAGSISGQLDTDNEGGGEECGGLAASLNIQYADYVLDDSYNDCERGDWGYRLLLPESALKSIEAGIHFDANSYARNEGSNDGAIRILSCDVK